MDFPFLVTQAGKRWRKPSAIEGKQEGLQVSWFGNGRKRSEAASRTERLKGFLLFIESGRPKAELNTRIAELDGPSTDWHVNGFKKEEAATWREDNETDGPQGGLKVAKSHRKKPTGTTNLMVFAFFGMRAGAKKRRPTGRLGKKTGFPPSGLKTVSASNQTG